MKINFYATLRQVTGQKTIELPLDGSITVRELLDQVINLYPAMHDELLDENGDLLQRVHVLINGRDVPYLENQMETTITARDTVNIFPAVGGG
jgi:sulfur-carrier protein